MPPEDLDRATLRRAQTGRAAWRRRCYPETLWWGALGGEPSEDCKRGIARSDLCLKVLSGCVVEKWLLQDERRPGDTPIRSTV